MKQKKKSQKSSPQIPDLPSKEDPKGGFTGGVRVATGDVNNDGVDGFYIDDIIIGAKKTRP